MYLLKEGREKDSLFDDATSFSQTYIYDTEMLFFIQDFLSVMKIIMIFILSKSPKTIYLITRNT